MAADTVNNSVANIAEMKLSILYKSIDFLNAGKIKNLLDEYQNTKEKKIQDEINKLNQEYEIKETIKSMRRRKRRANLQYKTQ